MNIYKVVRDINSAWSRRLQRGVAICQRVERYRRLALHAYLQPCRSPHSGKPGLVWSAALRARVGEQ